ncbi:MAG: hypothetical protein AAF748_16770 [Pseudomonadota bacterium]
MVRSAVFVIAGALTFAPAHAQNDELSEGIDLLDEGMRLLFRGLMNEMEPAMRDLQEGLSDLSGYHPPEFLPNGDIIIRRKTPLEPELGDNGDVEL